MENKHNTIKQILISIAVPLIVGYGTFLFTRDKYKVGVQSDQIENVKQAISIYRAMAEDSYKETKKLRLRVLELEKEVAFLKQNCK